MNEIGLYVHIPFCIRKCDYCDFLSGVFDEKTQQAYVMSLCKEIQYGGQQLRSVAVSSIYIGGGTPSWLDWDLMGQILDAIYSYFTVKEDAEISIECNPGTVTNAKFAAYRHMGINRLSIGLQSANAEELKILGRVHDYKRFLHTFDMARKNGFDNINVDIMTGLPHQTGEKLMNTLESVIQLRPEHISAYSLIVEEGTPFFERYEEDVKRQHLGEPTINLPDEDTEYGLYKMTQRVLESHGYHQYEISNYAKEGYRCEHNVIYWKRKPYLGVGIGAASLIENIRGTNVRDIYDYMKRCDELQGEEELSPLWDSRIELSRYDAMEEFMFLGLRMNEGVTREEFQKNFGCSIEGIYGNQLKKLKQEELLVLEAGRIRLTEKGTDLSNYALAHFLFEKNS